MFVREELDDLKKHLFLTLSTNRNYEFEANLENHPLEESQNIYRLH